MTADNFQLSIKIFLREWAPTKENVSLSGNKVLFYQDNARVHTCVVTMTNFYEFGHEMPQCPLLVSKLIEMTKQKENYLQ